MGLRSLLEITCCGGSSNRAPAGAAKTKHYVMINLKRQGLVVLYVLSSGWHHRRSRQREALSSGYPRMPGSRGRYCSIGVITATPRSVPVRVADIAHALA